MKRVLLFIGCLLVGFAHAQTPSFCVNSTFTPSNTFLPANPNNCVSSNFEWTVLDASGRTISSSVLTIVNGQTVAPKITIAQPGIYQIKACDTTRCGVLCKSTAIEVGPSFAAAGVNQVLCNPSKATLAAQTPLIGAGKWKQIFGKNILFIDAADPKTTINPISVPDSIGLVWEISYKNCKASTDTTIVVARPAVTFFRDGAGLDTNICNFTTNSSLVLNASIDKTKWYEVGVWSIGAGAPAGSGVFSDKKNPKATFNYSKAGTYNLVWSISNDAGCTPFSASVKIAVFDTLKIDAIIAPANTCLGNNIECNLATNGKITKWQYLPNPLSTSSWVNYNSTSSKITFNNVQDTFSVRAMVASAAAQCPALDTTTAVTIRVPKPVVNTIIDTTVTACSSQPLTIEGKKPTGGNGVYSYEWQQSLDNSNWSLLSPAQTKQNLTILAPAGIALIYYRRLVTSVVCTKTSTAVKVNINNNVPVANFSVNVTEACGPVNATFTNKTNNANGFFNFIWKIGDKIVSTNRELGTLVLPINPTYQDTLYTVTLIAYTPCIADSLKKQILVHAKPKAWFIPDKSGGCSPLIIRFNNTSQGVSTTSYTWNFDDAAAEYTSNNLAVPPHTYFSGIAQTYNVRLIAKNGCGSDTASFPIEIIPNKINLDFIVKGKDVVCNRNNATFVNNTTGATSFSWNFGDGNLLTTQEGRAVVLHQYADTGTYTVSVTASGCSDTTASKTIRVYLTPNSKFTVVPISACTGESVVHTNLTDFASGYIWKFGDGDTATTTNPSHIYTRAGNYKDSLIALQQYPGGLTCSDTTINFVSVQNLKGLIVTPKLSCTERLVEFSANISTKIALNSIVWNFGNGETALNIEQPQSMYLAAGTYSVAFTAKTTNGCNVSLDTVITLHASPNVKANNDVTICLGKTDVQLSATGATKYTWVGDNLKNSNSATPLASPLVTTQYVVTGLNDEGCSTSDSVVVNVVQPFKIRPSSNDSICVRDTTRLGASGASKYSWFPAETLDQPNTPNPRAWPDKTTQYRVIGKDNFNCFADTAYVKVEVSEYPIVKLIRGATLQAGTQIPLSSAILNGPIRDYRWSPVTDLNLNNLAEPVATLKNNICYQLTATNTFGCPGTDSVCFKVFCQSTQIFIANAFTPGLNNANSRLYVQGNNVKIVKSFRIFNRWGQVVFERVNFPPDQAQYGWDGTFKGNHAPTDVYVYTCEVVCENDVAFVYKGNVTLLR